MGECTDDTTPLAATVSNDGEIGHATGDAHREAGRAARQVAGFVRTQAVARQARWT